MKKTILPKIGRFIDSLAVISGNVSGICIFIIAFSVIYEVVIRSFFGRPSSWTIELSVHLTIAATFLGAPYVAKEGKNVSIDILTLLLPAKTRRYLDFVVHLCAIPFLFLFVYSIIKLLETSRRAHIVTPALEIPLHIPQSVLLVGIILLILQYLKIAVLKGADLLKEKGDSEPAHAPAVLGSFFGAVLAGVLLLFAGGNLHNFGIIFLILVFLLCGMPIFMGLIVVSSIGFFIFSPGFLLSQLALAEAGYASLEKFELAAIPLFILGGTLVGVGKMSDRLYDFFQVCTNRIPGSLAIASVLSCAVFAAMSGSGISGALTIGIVAIPAMQARGYDKRLAIGAVASAGTLGLLIPPSIAMIVYASLTSVSVGRLFMGGVFPGLFIAAMLSLFVLIRCWRDPKYRVYEHFTAKQKRRTLVRSLPALSIPVFLLGSIYGGIATPTEAASVLVFWALIFGMLYGEINTSNIWEALRSSRAVCASLLMIFVSAHMLTLLAARVELPENIIAVAMKSGLPPWSIIVFINVLILFLGMIFESGALMMILTPMIVPLIESLGYDPLWFGVLFVINIEIAQISPPVGIVLYALQAALGERIGTIMKSVIPFAVILILCLLVVGLVPWLVTWLPSKMIP